MSQEPKGWAKGWVSYLRNLLATLPSWPVLEAREGVKGSNTGEEQGPGLRAICILLGLGETGSCLQARQANFPPKPSNPPKWGGMGTHLDKVGASKVPNDSCGCADAHVANDGEKPPVRKKGQGRS